MLPSPQPLFLSSTGTLPVPPQHVHAVGTPLLLVGAALPADFELPSMLLPLCCKDEVMAFPLDGAEHEDLWLFQCFFWHSREH